MYASNRLSVAVTVGRGNGYTYTLRADGFVYQWDNAAGAELGLLCHLIHWDTFRGHLCGAADAWSLEATEANRAALAQLQRSNDAAQLHHAAAY